MDSMKFAIDSLGLLVYNKINKLKSPLKLPEK